MRTRFMLVILVMVAVLAACTAEQATTTLVADDGKAPYYTDLADALNAATADQYIVADFYTDW